MTHARPRSFLVAAPMAVGAAMTIAAIGTMDGEGSAQQYVVRGRIRGRVVDEGGSH
ncbi:MAG: hypothetical protein R6U63_00445 [Longimicrobiales bacterium]